MAERPRASFVPVFAVLLIFEAFLLFRADPLGFCLSDIFGMLMVYNKHADRIRYGGHYAHLVVLFGLKLHLENSIQSLSSEEMLFFEKLEGMLLKFRINQI